MRKSVLEKILTETKPVLSDTELLGILVDHTLNDECRLGIAKCLFSLR